ISKILGGFSLHNHFVSIMNARVSMEIAGEVGERVAPLLGWSSGQKRAEVEAFIKVIKNYLLYQ
ncbi:MAG: hypothetical protein WD577_08160, partial [Bacteroidales bacterium]